MIRHPATLAQVSPLQLRQGLFFSLALLLTLIAGQLYHHWQHAQVVRAVPEHVTLLHKASVSAPRLQMQSRPAALSSTSDEVSPAQQRWVF
ncbi:hypothetical protein [Pseudomonas sp. H9]|uniref:hypothetical protein n=1 Tax=Pseudomonas sp. H9 TaxID=483968 RepID=UPI0021157738|nr:hypothetical protein [Pseudomonas sp. H9]